LTNAGFGVSCRSFIIEERSFKLCEDLLYGRMSFKGFNPEIEVLFKYSVLRWSCIRIEAVGDGDLSVHTACGLAFAALSINPHMYRKSLIQTQILISATSGK